MLSSVRKASGGTAPFGALPAENDRKRPAPSLRRIDSARIERAQLPGHRNKTLYIWSGTASLLSLWRAAGLKALDDRFANLRPAAAAIPKQENRDVPELRKVGAIDDRTAVSLGGDEAGTRQDREMSRKRIRRDF